MWKTGNIQKVIIITICWTSFIAFTYLDNYFFVADLIQLEALSGEYLFGPDFIGIIILSIIGGLVGGYILVFRMERRYRHKSFAYGIINSGLLFILFYILIGVLGLFVMDLIYFSLQTDLVSAAQKSFDNVMFNVTAPSSIITVIYAALIVSFTQFMLQVNDKFGPGVLWKLITGKYYNPSQEVRIFMFLDLKSSTTIAERLGSRLFFELLRDFFSDITDPVISAKGEVYQYIGDEVVITWPLDKGLEKNNCIICFFRIKEIIQSRRSFYEEKYGFIPSFRAGLHLGQATVGEIGVIKKDIVYSGDVLNTTSRIQNECRVRGVNLLVSSTLLQRLTATEEFVSVPIGEIQLRGKLDKVMLNSVNTT